MSIRSIQCPGCQKTLNIPVAMANVKCPSCDTIWNVDHPSAARLGAAALAAKQEVASDEKAEDNATRNVAIIASLIGGAMTLIAIVGISIMILNKTPPPQAASAEQEETIKPRNPVPYRVVKLPDEQRQRIYADYRAVARTTVEKALILPQGTKARKSLEDMLEKTYDRELVHFAMLHDIEVEDVVEIIKEGDAKVWDDSPRSNAVRDGKRVYSKEMSEGWEKSPNTK